MISTSSLSKLSADLRRLPTVVAHRVADRAAPKITDLARKTYEASETPEGVSWLPGKDGQTVTLRKTGAMFRHMFYVAIGAALRVSLGVPYAKYQIGRRPVFPRQKGLLPAAYTSALTSITADTVKAEVRS